MKLKGYVNYNKNGLVIGGDYKVIDSLVRKTESDFLVVAEGELYHVCQETHVVTRLS